MSAFTTITEPITVGYWAIRGLAAPLRMMVMFRNVPLNAVLYEAKECGTGDGFDRSAWFDVKPALKAQHPLMNLPYVQLSGEKPVVQTNACLLHLGRRLQLLGDNEDELSMCEQLLCECMDLRNRVTDFAYGRVQGMESWMDSVKNHPNGQVAKLELWLKVKYEGLNWDGESTDLPKIFFVGSRASAPDFHIWEILDQLIRMARYGGLPDPLTTRPALRAFHASFASLEENQRYLSSALYLDLPVNFPSATNFGATPSGAPWEFAKTEYTWAGKSGVY